MDTSVFWNHVRHIKAVFNRLSKLQSHDSKTANHTEAIKILRGVGLIIISICLGWISFNETEKSTRQSMLNFEWPSQKVWESVLKHGGWVQIKNEDYSNILKYHPNPFTDEATVWVSHDHCFIYTARSPYHSQGSELWACSQRPVKKDKIRWSKVGSGYSGINQISEFLTPKRKIVTTSVDPKEIRY